MEEISDMAVVKKISIEVNDVKDKAFTSKQCYKAQIRTCKNVFRELKTANLEYNLQSESNKNLKENLVNSTTNFNSLLNIESAQKKANSEIIYSYICTKEWNLELLRRMEHNTKMYKERWLRSKQKREGLPSVKILLQMQNNRKELLAHLQLQNEKINLLKDHIKSKRLLIEKTNQERIVKFAQFMIYERPKLLESIRITKAKIDGVNAMINKIKEMNVSSILSNSSKELSSKNVSEKQENTTKHFEWSTTPIVTKKLDDEIFKLSISISEGDFEAEIKNNLVLNPIVDIVNIMKPEENTFTENKWGTYFASQYLLEEKQNVIQSNTVPNEKQICLIDYKNIDEEEAQSMLSSVNPNILKPVTIIGSDSTKTRGSIDRHTSHQCMDTETTFTPMEITEIIEPVNQQFITPPAQFTDQILIEEKTNQQEKPSYKEASISANTNLKLTFKKSDNRKRVAFDVSEELETDYVVQESVVSPKSCTSSKMIRTDHFKKYKLDSSPQFIYAKNKRNDDKVFKSKFFSNSKLLCEKNVDEDKKYENEVDEHAYNKNVLPEENADVLAENKDDVLPVAVHNVVEQSEPSVSYGVQKLSSYSKDVSASFDATFSTNTTDDDHEYQSCIDPSLLLSPKGDMPGDNDKQSTEQIPNFLSGIKMKGLSFFSNASGESNLNSDQNFQNEDSFDFSFGTNKTKGGFFNIFH